MASTLDLLLDPSSLIRSESEYEYHVGTYFVILRGMTTVVDFSRVLSAWLRTRDINETHIMNDLTGKSSAVMVGTIALSIVDAADRIVGTRGCGC